MTAIIFPTIPSLEEKSQLKLAQKFDVSVFNQDWCLGIFLLEENTCVNNKIKKVIIDCRIFGNFAGYSGECVHTGLIPGLDAAAHEKLKDQ